MGRQPTARLPESQQPLNRKDGARSRVMAPVPLNGTGPSSRASSSCNHRPSYSSPDLSPASNSSSSSVSPSNFTQNGVKSNDCGDCPDGGYENEDMEAEEAEDEGRETPEEEAGRPPERTGDGVSGELGPRIGLRQSAVLNRVIEERRERLGTRNDPLCRRPTRFPGPALQSRGGAGAQRRGQRLSGACRNVADDSDEGEFSSGADAELRDYMPGEEEEEEEEEEDEEEEETPTLLWAQYLRTLRSRDPDFFRSAEARMETEATQGSQAATGLEQVGVENARGTSIFEGCRSRSTQYKGLETSKENCPDLRYVYEQEYEIQIRRGGKLDGYRQFRTLSGQLARFAVAVEVSEAEAFGRPGGLFQLATSSDVVRAFIGGFQAHAQAGTVYSKAVLLLRLCRLARQHFGKIADPGTAAVLSRIDETRNLLGGFSRVEKASSRRQTAVRRDQNRGANFIRPTDWYKLQRYVAQDIFAVSAGLTKLVDQLEVEDLDSYLDDNPAFVRKFSLLLLVYVLLVGSGQRPQAYWSLQHPDLRTVEQWERDNALFVRYQNMSRDRDGNLAEPREECPRFLAVKLYPAHEKTPRDTLNPGIVFPDDARAYFLNYESYIRPSIIRRAGMARADAADGGRTFLVHSETGRSLTGENLRSTLRTYVGGFRDLRDDLSRVTVMTVRASFATVMFRSFRRGKFPDQTSEQFLDSLAGVMNTSMEMLRTTYIKTSGTEFDDAARKFLDAARDEERISGSEDLGIHVRS
jgi:hypothetical protein